MRNLLVFLVLGVLLAVGCGGSGGTAPELPTLKLLSFEPSSGAPGTPVVADCTGISPGDTKLYLCFGEKRFPGIPRNDGQVSFFVPPLTATVYSVTLSCDGQISNSVNFKIEPISNLPYSQTDFAFVMSEGLEEINDLIRSLTFYLDFAANLYSDAEMSEINQLVGELDKICDDIRFQILELPTADAEMFQSVFFESGLLATLDGFRSGTYEGGDRYTCLPKRQGEEVFCPVHQCLYDGDNISMVITSCKFVVDTAFLASLIASGGTTAPALPVKLSISLCLTTADWILDTIVPTDLDYFVLQLNKEMNLGQVQYPKFIGYFRCQNDAQASSFKALMSILFDLISTTVPVPESTKEAITQAVTNKLIEIGIDIEAEHLDESLQGHDGPFIADYQTELDMAFYNLDFGEAINQSCPFVPLAKLFNFLEKIGWDPPILKDSVLIENSEILSYNYDTNVLLAKNAGETTLKANAYCMDPHNFWLFKLELQTPFEASESLIKVKVNSEDLTGIWEGWWKNTGLFVSGGGDYTLTITQTGTSVSGIAYLTDDRHDGWVIYQVEGGIENNKLKYRHILLYSYWPSPKSGAWCTSLDYTFPYAPETTVLDGTYRGILPDECKGLTGKCHLEKQ